MAILARWLRLFSLTIPTPQPNPRRSSGGKGAHFRPAVESLEGRLVPSTVRWANPAGGDWAGAANWDAGNVPGPDDDVVIDAPGGVTITHAAGQDAVHSLTSRNPLNLSGGSLDLAADSTLAALDLSGGTLTGTAQITVNGRLHWTAGTLAGAPNQFGTPWLAARGGLTLDGPDGKLLDGRDLDNRGSGSISDGPLTLHDARLTNWADETLRLTAATIQESPLWSGGLSNRGELQVLNGATLATSSVSNSGTIDIFQGWLTATVPTATAANSGDIHVWDTAGGLDARVAHFGETGSITGPGSVRIGSDDYTEFQGEFHVDGDATFSSHRFNPLGSLNFSVPDFYVGRELSLTDDIVFDFTSATVEARTLTLSNLAQGRLDGTALSVGLEIDVQGGIRLNLSSANVQTNTFMNQSGQLTVLDSTITARTFVNQAQLYLSGSSTIATTEKVYNRGSLVGTGTIVGDLVNEGRISMNWSQDAGQLTVTGDFTQTATGVLNLRIGASNPDASSDQLIVGGTARLDGTLSITLMAGYVPSAGDTFQALSFGDQRGDFATYNLPNLGDAMYLQAWSDGSGYSLTVQPA